MTTSSEHRVGLARWVELGGPSYSNIQTLRNLISQAVRGALGGDLSTCVQSRATVVIKPNWVRHYNRSGATMDCMITQLAFVEAMLLEVLATSPARVIIGDAPIQSADFDRTVPPSWRSRITSLGPVEVRDFRNVVTTVDHDRIVVLARDRRPDDLVNFDLGTESHLEPISSPAGRFRCTNYDPELMARVQRPGVHRYVISREPLEADVVINLPKLKTHCKAGITAALKNLVGINGNKDYLPHHRVGSPASEGDCYDSPHAAKRAAEVLLDAANRRIGRFGYSLLARVAAKASRIAAPIGTGGLEGAWYGNDTVWRMTLDLNRILRFGRSDGTISDKPQRTVLSITDAVIAGEGEGPMAPTPVPLGMVTCATSAAYADLVHATLMHFNWKQIPLVAHAFDRSRWPLVAGAPEDACIVTPDETYDLDELPALGRPFVAPAGWAGHL